MKVAEVIQLNTTAYISGVDAAQRSEAPSFERVAMARELSVRSVIRPNSRRANGSSLLAIGVAFAQLYSRFTLYFIRNCQAS